MKSYLNMAMVAAGLLCGAAALAQAPPPMPATDPALAPDPYATTVDTNYTYQTTGWDPSLLLYAGGALAAGSVGLKGVLRKRA